MTRERIAAVIEFARRTWRNDGAEGETVHALCDALETAEQERNTWKRAAKHDGVPVSEWEVRAKLAEDLLEVVRGTLSFYESANDAKWMGDGGERAREALKLFPPKRTP